MKYSAGILLYKKHADQLQILLVHPGGPFWRKKDHHAWSIPKGLFNPDEEEPETAALREFAEETGAVLGIEEISLLTELKTSQKCILVYMCNGDFDPENLVSNNFEMEWPPHSGNYQSFPEVDKAKWFSAEEAINFLHKGQIALVEKIREKLP